MGENGCRNGSNCKFIHMNDDGTIVPTLGSSSFSNKELLKLLSTNKAHGNDVTPSSKGNYSPSSDISSESSDSDSDNSSSSPKQPGWQPLPNFETKHQVQQQRQPKQKQKNKSSHNNNSNTTTANTNDEKKQQEDYVAYLQKGNRNKISKPLTNKERRL